MALIEMANHGFSNQQLPYSENRNFSGVPKLVNHFEL